MEHFRKYPKIKHIGDEEIKDLLSPEDEIQITEKLDGGNARFSVMNGKLIFGSRTQQLTSDKGEDTNLNKQFVRCVNFVREKFKEKPNRFQEGYIYYGENMVKHSLDYNWETIPPFLGFDIFDMKKGEFISNPHEVFEFLGLPSVPILKTCKAKELEKVDENLVPITKYPPVSNPKQLAEGIVIKNYSKQLFGKMVREKFKETDKKAFGESKKNAKDASSKIVAQYCTNARIDKAIFKLLDEGNELSIKLMHLLPNAVYWDIMEEHWKDIVGSRDTVDFKKVKQKVSKRCLAVLKMVMINNSLNEDK